MFDQQAFAQLREVRPPGMAAALQRQLEQLASTDRPSNNV